MEAEHREEQAKPELTRELRIRLPNFRSILAIISMVAVIIIVGIVVFVFQGRAQDPLPADVKQEANFTLYYPRKLPAGLHFDKAIYDSSTRVVTYDYATDIGNKLYFSLQPKPEGFNFDDFNKKQLSGAHQTSTPVGVATIGILQQETVSSVVTDKTWILISAGEKISLDQLEQVSKSLTPVKQ